MSIELKPYTDFSSDDLSHQLLYQVYAHRGLLESRELWGVLSRYGSGADTALQGVNHEQEQQRRGNLGCFAIIGAAGDVIGAAAIDPNLTPTRSRVLLSSKMAIRGLSQQLPFAKPNIHAWINGAQTDHLAEAYKQLLLKVRSFDIAEPRPFTIEPVKSPIHVHAAIILAGMRKIVDGRFNDPSLDGVFASRSWLYAVLRGGESKPARGLRELKSGS